MKKAKLIFAIMFTIILVVSSIGCAKVGSGTQGDTTIGSDKKDTTSSSPESIKSEDPVKFSIFYQEANQNFPDGFKHNDNWFINYICELANVELIEVNVPAYTDTATKFNLMMSSGEIPDLVVRADPAEMKRYGAEGAFMPTEDIIRSSPVLAPFYDDVQLEAMKSEDGVAYIIQTPPLNDDYPQMWTRWDLLEKMGYTEVPESTVDEWLKVLRDIKKYDPSSIPLSGVASTRPTHAFATFGFNIGSTGCGWLYYPERGKVCNVWEGDNVVKSVKFSRMIYNEGLLDKEYYTNTSTDARQKNIRNNVMLVYNNFGSFPLYLQHYLNDNQPDVRLMPIPIPMAEGVGVDKYYKVPSVLGSYAFGINANTKALDGIIRFLEVIYGPEVEEISTYGREGIEYKVVNNEKVPIFPAAVESSWRSLYGWVTLNSASKLSNSISNNIYGSPTLSDKEKTDYLDLVNNADKYVRSQIYGYVGYNPLSLANPIEDDLLNLASQVIERQKSLIAKAVVGEISIDDFLMEKDKIVEKYQDITDAYNKVTDEAKARFNLK